MRVAPPVPRARPPGRARRGRIGAERLVWAMAAAYAGLFGALSVARHNAFWTGRFDVGNMVQAVWSTAQGRPLRTTDIAGVDFVRLGAHVDPILVLFAPLAWTPWLPEGLLVAQAAIVATGALPAFWLGRRWLGDDRLALAAAAVYLLYPPLQWATLTEFHPVTLAAPLLMFCIWAAEERRYVVLSILAVLTALTKEEVGLALAMLGIWMVVRDSGRRFGAFLAAAALAWVAFAVLVVIPRYNAGEGSAFVDRYGTLGDSGSGVVTTLITRPWEAVAILVDPDRLAYLADLLVPLLFLPLAAPLLLAGALPELLINMLADWFPQYSIRFQYVAVIVPFVVAASILGLARLRRARRPAALVRLLAHPGRVAVVWVGVVAVSGVHQGPLPWWSEVPVFGSSARVEQFRAGAHADVLGRAVAMVPDDVPVSAGNLIGAHLSERARIYTFPVVADARWVLIDRRRPYLGDRLAPGLHAVRVEQLRARPDLRLVMDQDGVMVFRRVPARGEG